MHSKFFISTALIALVGLAADARVGGYGNNSRLEVQNRSATVNHNAKLNRNTNVSMRGGYYGGGVVVEDNSWNWGLFAAVTTAAVAAASHPATTTVVAVPAVGTVVTALPAGCGVVSGGGTTIYGCNNVHYRPYYQGSSLVYQVVTYP